jgi:hypothetical protein
MNDEDLFSYVTTTEEFLLDHISSVEMANEIFDLILRIGQIQQVAGGTVVDPPPSQPAANRNGSATRKKERQRLRSLQDEGTGDTQAEDDIITTPSDTLNVLFTVTLRYRSEDRDHDIATLVGSAWETTMDRANYVMRLQAESDIFDQVTEVDVRVRGYEPPLPTESPASVAGDKVNIAVIVGASVGGAALVVLVVLLFMTVRRRSQDSLKHRETEESRGTPSTQHKNVKVSTEILVEPQDDVSTLGDPMFFGPGGMMMAAALDKDEVTAR